MTQPFSGKRREWPLAAIFTWRFAAVTTIPIVILSLLFAFYFAPKIKQEVENRHESYATGVVSQTERYFAIATRELGTLRRLIDSGVRFDDELSSLLDSYAMASDFYEAIYLADSRGRIISIGLPSATRGLRGNHLGLDLSAREFIKESQVQGKPVWSNSALSAISGRLSVAVAVPVGDLTLIGEIAVSPLPELARKLTEQTPLVVMMIDRGNQLVAHSRDTYANQQLNLGDLPLVQRGRTEHATGTHAFEFDGKSWVGSARLVSGPDWLVVVAEAPESAYAQIHGFWLRLGIGFGLALLAAMGAATWAARMLSQRFEPYNKQAQAIANGCYELPPIDSGTIELNRIGDSLLRMGQAIQDREIAMRQAQKELLELNTTLEDRVDERTDEMTRANVELVQTLETLHETQDHLFRSDKLAALGSMVAGIAHELNTPIGNSLMAASTLNDHNRSFDKELAAGPLRRSTLDRFVADNRVATEILLRNLGRAGELITSFKQVAVDQTSSQRRNFTVNEIVDEILMTLNPTLKKTPYMVDTDITPDLWMDSFPGPLGQVLTNLINNALTHAFDGRQYGVIGIKAVWTGDKSRIVITLTDNGKGIPPANITRVFDPFFTTKLGRGGSGLGLNIVHNLVTGILGGHIDVASVEHEQTRFSIELPVKAPIVVGAE